MRPDRIMAETMLVGLLSLIACAAVATGSGGRVPASQPTRLPLCNPAAADYQKQGAPTPAPCISFDPESQMRDNLRYLQRGEPKAADVAALRPAEADLNQALQNLRARDLYDWQSVARAVATYPSLRGALVGAASANERLSTSSAISVVVLEHGSACLLGEHGPTASVVYVVGHTLDGSCTAFHGH